MEKSNVSSGIIKELVSLLEEQELLLSLADSSNMLAIDSQDDDQAYFDELFQKMSNDESVETELEEFIIDEEKDKEYEELILAHQIKLMAKEMILTMKKLEAVKMKNQLESKLSSAKSFLLEYPHKEGLKRIIEKNPEPFDLTNSGNAKRLAYYFGDLIRYVKPAKAWMIWHGNVWKTDSKSIMLWFADKMRDIILKEEKQANSANRRNALQNYALKVQSYSSIQGMLGALPGEPGISIEPKDLDARPLALNCENGILSLRKGTLYAHEAKYLLTKKANVAFDETADCPLWRGFVSQIMMNDHEMIEFIQEVAGYSLSEDTMERVMFIFYGGGKNGKSTFINVLRDLLGDYSLVLPGQTLLKKTGFAGIGNDIADLKGVRLAITSETDDGQAFSESLIKQLTGGTDKIAARKLYQEYERFFPVAKLFVLTNHMVEVQGTDTAIWERLRLVPFLARFDGQMEDKSLFSKLLTERPGILNWALEGYKRYKKRGTLVYPMKMKKAIEEYRKAQDIVGGFLEDCCEIKEGVMTETNELYRCFTEWCNRAGVDVKKKNGFGREMKARGCGSKQVSQKFYYMNVLIKKNK